MSRAYRPGDRVRVRDGRWTGQGSQLGTVTIWTTDRSLVRFDDGGLVDIRTDAIEPANPRYTPRRSDHPGNPWWYVHDAVTGGEADAARTLDAEREIGIPLAIPGYTEANATDVADWLNAHDIMPTGPTTTRTPPTYTRADIIAAMARTLEVLSYMAWCDAWDEACSEDFEAADDRPEGAVSAGAGENWHDIAPELDLGELEATGISWREEAAILYGRIWQAWGADPWLVLVNNGIKSSAGKNGAESWGHYAVMSAIGHGVSWEDSHDELVWVEDVLPTVGALRFDLDIAPAWPDRWPAS